MNSIFTYILELNIAITLCYAIYLLVFRKDSNFNARRSFLFAGMIISTLIPLFHIQLGQNSQLLTGNIYTLEELIFTAEGQAASSRNLNLAFLFQAAYLLIGAFLLIRTIASILHILIQRRKSGRMPFKGQTVIDNEKLHASSFFHLIFIDSSKVSSEEMDMIVEHEKVHAKLWHSLDRLLSEMILILAWANPVSWMLRRSIVVNHEYQADNKVIEDGTDQLRYQITILNQYIGSASISNQFSNQIKKRITMLNKNYKKGSFWKSILLIPLSLILFVFISCENKSVESDDLMLEDNVTEVKKSLDQEVFYVVEEMPKWPGEEDMILQIRKFIASNLKYPEAAKESGAEGKVFVTFMVTRTGDVIVPDPSILPPPAKNKEGEIGEVVVVTYRQIDSEKKMPEDKVIQAFKDEGVRVVELLPDMTPGKQRGKDVNVLFTMPISFVMQ